MNECIVLQGLEFCSVGKVIADGEGSEGAREVFAEIEISCAEIDDK